MKHKKIIALGIIVLLMFSVGCTKGKHRDVNNYEPIAKVPVSEDQEKKRTLEYTIADMEFSDLGSGIGLLDKNGDPVYGNVGLRVEKDEDVNFSVRYIWFSDPPAPKPVNFHLGVYLDYEQIDFLVGDNKNKVKKHQMQLNSNEELNIPITIPSESITGTHKLIITIEYAEQIPKHKRNAIAAIYDLVAGERTDYIVPQEVSDSDTIHESNYWAGSIFISQNFKAEYIEGEPIDEGTEEIRAAAGEIVPLALRFSGKGDKGVFFLTIQGEQTDLEEKKFFYFEDQGSLMFKKSYFIAPQEKGEYVLCGYYISSPYDIEINAGMDKASTTFRLKLVVE